MHARTHTPHTREREKERERRWRAAVLFLSIFYLFIIYLLSIYHLFSPIRTRINAISVGELGEAAGIKKNGEHFNFASAVRLERCEAERHSHVSKETHVRVKRDPSVRGRKYVSKETRVG